MIEKSADYFLFSIPALVPKQAHIPENESGTMRVCPAFRETLDMFFGRCRR